MKLLNILLVLFFGLAVQAQNSLQRAQELYLKNEFQKSELELNQYLKQNPTSFDAQLLLAKVHSQLEHWDTAVAQFKILKQKNTNQADLHYYYGAALAMQAKNSNKLKALTKLNAIEKSFSKALALNPNHIDAHWAFITYYTELPGILGGSTNKAKNYAQKLLNISAVDGYLAYGYIYEYEKDYSNAEKNYEQAHKIGHSKTTYKKLYDLYLNKLKNTKKAEQLRLDFNNK